MNPLRLEHVERPERSAAPPFFPLRLTPRGFDPAAARRSDPRKGNAQRAATSKVRSAPAGARTPKAVIKTHRKNIEYSKERRFDRYFDPNYSKRENNPAILRAVPTPFEAIEAGNDVLSAFFV